MGFLIVGLPSLMVVMIMKLMFKTTISTKEFFIHIGVVLSSVVLCIVASYGFQYASMGDVQIINGQVTGKEIHKEYCSEWSSCTEYHYKQRCHVDSKGKKQCESYKVFHYPYEFFYNVQSTVGDYTIHRIDDQGTKVPPRFAMVKNGDIASTESMYMNYIFANKDSIFNKYSEDSVLNDPTKMKDIPDYPEIVDYYNMNRVFNSSGFSVPILPVQDYLEQTLNTMGARKQVNILVVLYNYEDTKFVQRTLLKWRGGKKNDVLLFYGIDKNLTVRYFSSTSYAEGMGNAELHSTLRMDNLDKPFSTELVKANVGVIDKKFTRLPAKEFEYLKLNISPSLSAMVISSLLCLVCSIIFGVYLHKEELA